MPLTHVVTMKLRLLLALALVTSLVAVPAVPSSAAVETTVHYVETELPSGSTELIRVEVRRDSAFDAQGQAIVGTMSPYNSLRDVTSAGTAVSNPTIPGIASASIDVLGTRGSTGCWDYGGFDEMKAGVDAVRFLAGDLPDVDGNHLDWSNGRVGLTGGSYDGTTATMVAAAPPEMWSDERANSIDEDGTTPLKAIVPVAAISHWYGYAYAWGMRMTDDGESSSPTDEDILTPLAFDLGFGLTVHADQPGAAAQRGCNTAKHTLEAYSRNPDYGDFWLERDYATPEAAARWTTHTLIVHGWNDYNVKQYEATRLYEALAPFAADEDDEDGDGDGEGFDLRLWMGQGRHNVSGYGQVRDTFFSAYLLDGEAGDKARDALDAMPKVRSEGETTGGKHRVTFSDSWPPEDTTTHTFFLNRTYEQDLESAGVTVPGPGTGEVGELSYSNAFEGPLAGRDGEYGITSGWLDTGLTGEEVATRDPWSNDGQKLDTLGGQGYYSLHFSTTPLTRDVRIAGSAVLEGYFNYLATVGATLTPILVDIDPNDRMKVIQRGFLNLDYRDGLEETAPNAQGWIRADVTFFPEDYTVPEGHRIGMILTSSNPVWTVPGNPAGFVSVGLGPSKHLPGSTAEKLQTATGTVLHLPFVDVDEDERVFEDWARPDADDDSRAVVAAWVARLPVA